jgi:ribosome-associated protein
MTATDFAKEMALLAAHGAADKLAQDIVLIDVSDRLAITDMFVVASGANDRQVQAIVDSVEEKLREAGHRPTRREGERSGRWVLLDYLDVVIHVQHLEERAFYALERLWRDCPTFPYGEGPTGPSLTVGDLTAPKHPVAAPVQPAETADGAVTDAALDHG